jgi:hypothetical protein
LSGGASRSIANVPHYVRVGAYGCERLLILSAPAPKDQPLRFGYSIIHVPKMTAHASLRKSDIRVVPSSAPHHFRPFGIGKAEAESGRAAHAHHWTGPRYLSIY